MLPHIWIVGTEIFFEKLCRKELVTKSVFFVAVFFLAYHSVMNWWNSIRYFPRRFHFPMILIIFQIRYCQWLSTLDYKDLMSIGIDLLRCDCLYHFHKHCLTAVMSHWPSSYLRPRDHGPCHEIHLSRSYFDSRNHFVGHFDSCLKMDVLASTV